MNEPLWESINLNTFNKAEGFKDFFSLAVFSILYYHACYPFSAAWHWTRVKIFAVKSNGLLYELCS